MAAVAVELNSEQLSRQIADILTMGQGELEAAWTRHCRGQPPTSLPRSLLARLLAYRVQAATHGDLSPAHQRFLQRIAKDLKAGHKADLQLDDPFHLKPGTVLIREHGGEQHRVMVLTDGYAWKGEVHKSLSSVASAITGTRWNGHRFFGLDNRNAPRPTKRQTPRPSVESCRLNTSGESPARRAGGQLLKSGISP